MSGNKKLWIREPKSSPVQRQDDLDPKTPNRFRRNRASYPPTRGSKLAVKPESYPEEDTQGYAATDFMNQQDQPLESKESTVNGGASLHYREDPAVLNT